MSTTPTAAATAKPQKQRVVLAYSGGLDTSVMVKWLQVEKDLDVVAICVNVGQEPRISAGSSRRRSTWAPSPPRPSTCATCTPTSS